MAQLRLPLPPQRGVERFVWRWIALVIVVGALVALASFAPWRGILQVVRHRLSNDEGRSGALTVLERDGREVWLLGTTHDQLFTSRSFSIWDVKRVVEASSPDVVLLEILPQDVAANNLGGGPMEMAFVALLAAQRQARVVGIDAHWREGWGSRHTRMVENVDVAVRDDKQRRVLIVAGYGHVPSFVERLQQDGWQRRDAPDVYARSTTESYPAGYADALELAATTAEQSGAFRDDKDRSWFVNTRRALAAKVRG
jgi:hypothetical protein